MHFSFLNMPDKIGEKPLEFAAVQGDVVKDLLKQRLWVFLVMIKEKLLTFLDAASLRFPKKRQQNIFSASFIC